MPGGEGWPRRAALTLAVVGALALLAAMATPLVGLLVDPPRQSTTRDLTIDVDRAGVEATVRELPLLPAGTVTRAGLSDPETVTAAIRELAGVLGLGDRIDYLLTTYEYPGAADVAYPYRYPTSDPVVADLLDPRRVSARPDAVVELAGLLAVLATTTTDDVVLGPAPAATAYSLLSRAREVEESCDLSLTLLWLVTLGDRPRLDAVDEETRRARAACGDEDVMPALVRAQWLSRHATVVQTLVTESVRPSRLRTEARAAWLDLQARYPASPWGFAGLADLEARWADQAESVSAAPFQVLTWRRAALAGFAAAAALTDDPLLDLREAAVRLKVGQEHVAVAAGQAAVSALGDDVVARMTLTDALAETGEHEAAAASADLELGLPSPWWLGRGSANQSDLYRDYAQRVVPQVFVVDASIDSYGGGFVNDLGFLPQSRTRFAAPECRREVRVRELLLAGRLDDAGRALDAPPGTSAGVAALCLGGATDAYDHVLGPALAVLDRSSADAAGYDLAQDLLRGAGDLEGAQDVALEWAEAYGDDGLAHERLAEIFLLAGDAPRARSELETAIPLLESTAASYDGSLAAEGPNPVKDLCLAQLLLGLAHDRHDDRDEALRAYRAAADTLVPLRTATRDDPPEIGTYPGALEVYAHAQAGSVLSAQGRADDAVHEYRLAVRAGKPYEPTQLWATADGRYRSEPVLGGPLSGAQSNNLALLLSLQGEHDEAVEQGRAAVAEDPASSVFADTLAFTHQRAGNDNEAIAAYRRVVRADPTAYVSANNLGVLLAEAGDRDAADHWFRQAIATRPDYAQAWHNLGSLLRDQWAPKSYVASQAAFAEAVRLDPSYRDVEPGFAMDSQVRDLDLDVSRPLDPDWQFATSVDEQGTPFTAVLLLLVLGRILWSLGLDNLVGRGTQGALAHGGRLAFLSATLPAWTATALCVGLLSWSVVMGGLDWSALLVVFAVVGLVTVPLVLRSGARHRSWLPAMAVGVVLVPLGAPFAPYPHVVASKARPTRLMVLLPALVVGAALTVFAVESALAGTPVSHRLTTIAAVLLASVLVPVPPLDGSRHTGRLLGVGTAVALGAVTVALAAGWV